MARPERPSETELDQLRAYIPPRPPVPASYRRTTALERPLWFWRLRALGRRTVRWFRRG